METVVYDGVRTAFAWNNIIIAFIIGPASYMVFRWIGQGHFDNNTPLGGFDTDTAMLGIIGILYRSRVKRPYGYKIPRIRRWIFLFIGIAGALCLITSAFIEYYSSEDPVEAGKCEILEGRLESVYVRDDTLVFRIDGRMFRLPGDALFRPSGRATLDLDRFKAGKHYRIYYLDKTVLRISLINVP